MYTKTEVNQLLTGKTSSFDITSAIAETADTSTTYTKSDLDNLLTGKGVFISYNISKSKDKLIN